MHDSQQLNTPAGVDREKLLAWLDEQGVEAGPVGSFVELGGGTQNIILRFNRGRRNFVLRRPSLHPRPEANQTMVREATILKALADTDVPHPKLIAACADPDVLGSAFYVMEAVDGFCAPETMPAFHLASPRVRYEMSLNLAESAARLGSVDYTAVGLASFGKSEGFLERQTGRWRSQLESYEQHQGWSGPKALGGVDKIQTWLDDHIPSAGYRAGILHGDFHIANMLFRFDSADVAAIIDWELATIGDPLLDLGWLLATWPDENGQLPDPGIAVQGQSDFARPAELIRHYGQFVDRDMAVMPWYVVLACFKLGIILEGTYARASAGLAPEAIGLRLHHTALRLFERAQQWMASA